MLGLSTHLPDTYVIAHVCCVTHTHTPHTHAIYVLSRLMAKLAKTSKKHGVVMDAVSTTKQRAAMHVKLGTDRLARYMAALNDANPFRDTSHCFKCDQDILY